MEGGKRDRKRELYPNERERKRELPTTSPDLKGSFSKEDGKTRKDLSANIADSEEREKARGGLLPSQ